jgi:DNA-binding NarL/FixJ family response regulator
MGTHRRIHVVHAAPAMSAGLAVMLQAPEWRVSVHADDPGAAAASSVVVADYDAGLALVNTAAVAAARVLIVTHREREGDVRRALEAGVGGYVREDTDVAQLRHAVRCILGGARFLCPQVCEQVQRAAAQDRLTNRESQVLQLLARGYCNKLIARDLGIELPTVKWHVRSLMSKLHVSARTHAVVVAAQRGLVGLDQPAAG